MLTTAELTNSIVYRRNDTRRPADTRLSGVGLCDHGFDKAPLAQGAHFYDNNFEPDDLLLFRLTRRHGDEPASVLQQDGYPFHLACWDLLELVAGARHDINTGSCAISLDHLYQFLNCFPEQHGRINWGHHHGVFEYEQSAYNFAGFEHVFDSDSRGWSGYHQDPTDSYPIQAALRFPKKSPNILPLPIRCVDQPSISSASPPGISQKDTFSRIPTEIRHMILFQLSSPDVLSLKLACWSFAEVQLDDAFWASRFDPSQEMEHIYEARDGTVRRGNWRDTYFEMVDQQSRHDTLRNRARIMGIGRVLVDILRRMGEPAAALQGLVVECSVPGPDGMFDSWSAAGAAAVTAKPWRTWPDMPPTREFDLGAQVDSSRVRLLPGISRAARTWVSFIDLPDARYISGLRVEDTDTSLGSSVGYIHADNEELLLPLLLPVAEGSDGEGEEEGARAVLSGFELAVGSRGVLGIRQLAGADGRVKGRWVGRWAGVPRKLLPLGGSGEEDELYMLTCGFDVSRFCICLLLDMVGADHTIDDHLVSMIRLIS